MAFDRVVTLRNAEKLIRQGKLDAGIAEYVRVVEEAPGDWNAKNTLGDLYARLGKVDKAVEQFIEIATHLGEEGSTAKAGAIYKKILKLKPDHEHALIQVADILGGQRLYADARAHLNSLIELRRSKGDARGVLQAKVRLGSLDPDDYDGRMTAASARIEMGDIGGALSEMKDFAGELSQKGRQTEAIQVLREAAKLNPEDDEIRERLLDVYFSAKDYTQARECATTVEQFRMIATALDAEGKADEALDTLRQASKQNDYDTALKAELARKFIDRGDSATAAEYLTVESAGDDPALLMTVATIQLRAQKYDEGLAILKRMLDADANRRDEIALLGWTIAEQEPEAGFRVVELAADASVAQGDWAAAAAALQEYVTRVPNHILALMRLVEICVDGGLEATMYSAQAQLADAYIANGSATEARFIAEDLVAREPWDRANVERFRRALVLLGEPDPDAIIADRLSGDSPFTSTDLFAPLHEEPPTPAVPVMAVDDLIALEAQGDRPVKKRVTKHEREDSRQFKVSANAVEFDFAELEEAPVAEAPGAPDDVEVDLSIAFDAVKPAASAAPLPPPAADAPSGDLDGVFGNLRDQASKRSESAEAEKEYKRGLALRAAGDIDGCIEALEKASKSPKLRFATARLIARLYRDRSMIKESLEWLERASQAPAPTADDGHQLSYELAEGLEQVGETARALAMLVGLKAAAGKYRDIEARIDRLTKVQARG